VITLLTRAEVSERARAFLAAARVAPEVLELRLDYRVLVIVAEGLQPGLPDQISLGLLAQAEARARIALDGRAPEDVLQVADWRAAYRAFGAKPQRTRPSVEALLRRLDTGLPRIDRLTDAYNAVSVANLVPVGGEDLDQYQGPARLVRATGDEDFGTVAHGEPTVEHPQPGEVIWRDDAGVTCRQWNWRQCRRTRITSATTNAVFIIDGLASLGHNGLAAAGNDLASSLTRLSPLAALASRVIALDQARSTRRNTDMMIHPWDAAISETGWRDWLAGHDSGSPPSTTQAAAGGGCSGLSRSWAGSCWWSSARPTVSPGTTGTAQTPKPRSPPDPAALHRHGQVSFRRRGTAGSGRR
jgi:DNA/RNA-binding domain of Phe-tRNA-synthetase-like protein